jgi:hypothetical protein
MFVWRLKPRQQGRKVGLRRLTKGWRSGSQGIAERRRVGGVAEALKEEDRSPGNSLIGR